MLTSFSFVVGPRAYRGIVACIATCAAGACTSRSPKSERVERSPEYSRAGALPTGRVVDPEGSSRAINPLTLTMLRAPQSRFVLVQSGYGPQGIQVIDTLGVTRQTINQKAAFVGAAWSPDSSMLYVSGGDRDMVYAYRWREGRVSLIDSLILAPLESERAHGTRYPAGIGVSLDGKRLYVAENLGDHLAVLDLASKHIIQRVPTGPYPYGVSVSANGTVLVSVWSASHVLAFASSTEGVSVSPQRWPVARHPSSMVLSPNGARVFVTSGSTNRISVLNAVNGAMMAELRDPPPSGPDEGTTPSNVALSDDGSRLFVTEADANAVAVFDLSAKTSGVSTASGRDQLIGRIPTDWYPSAVVVHGDALLIANSKGHGTQPNALDGPGPRNSTLHTGAAQKPAGYTLEQLQGTLTIARVARADSVALAPLSSRVARANYWDVPRTSGFAYPPIRHVIYVIKENRTYDQVFGDLADGDTSLLYFDRSVSPNHHALAERFGIYDRFLVNAEASPDGHNWSMAAYTTDYLQRTVPSNYGGKGRSYDYEGSNRGVVPDDDDDDVNAPAQGYLWDAALRKHISIRNYGEFVVGVGATRETPPTSYRAAKSPMRAYTNSAFPGFDLKIPDQHRADIWIAELRAFARADTMPRLMIVRLPNDHTSGAAANAPSPKAAFADNDLALGRMIDALSQTKFWRESAVFVVEDDAQNGPDHIDSHRAPFLLVSPWAKSGVTHRFANTTDVIATMEELLGLDALSQFDFYGRPLRDVWRTTPDTSRYVAVTPTQSLNDKNPKRSAAGALSDKLDWSREDIQDEAVFNRVLWMALKGEQRPMPKPMRMSQLELIRAR